MVPLVIALAQPLMSNSHQHLSIVRRLSISNTRLKLGRQLAADPRCADVGPWRRQVNRFNKEKRIQGGLFGERKNKRGFGLLLDGREKRAIFPNEVCIEFCRS